MPDGTTVSYGKELIKMRDPFSRSVTISCSVQNNLEQQIAVHGKPDQSDCCFLILPEPYDIDEVLRAKNTADER